MKSASDVTQGVSREPTDLQRVLQDLDVIAVNNVLGQGMNLKKKHAIDICWCPSKKQTFNTEPILPPYTARSDHVERALKILDTLGYDKNQGGRKTSYSLGLAGSLLPV
ncbi:hypothetical protein MKW98_002526 [Papaver atlanticum]|uniref:Uncharacterized protein n=1 Tax=Papaver atlanticum TaxID=357466 RepID=A0AAD4SBK1_9MAGN|nr:hypothetical protein MKW98_002526 [Papaver atlanticum]